MEESRKHEEASKREAVKKLSDEKRRTQRKISNLTNALQEEKEELRKINESICSIQGYQYTSWEMHNGVIDRTWNYTHKCSVCGKEEVVEEEPEDYTY